MRGHRFKLCQEGSKLNIRRQSFPVRIAKVWNELPDSVVNAPNVSTFKKRLDRHWRGEDFLDHYEAPKVLIWEEGTFVRGLSF